MPKVLCLGHCNTCRGTQAKCLMRLLFDRKADVHLQVNTTALLRDHKDELAIYFALDSQEPDSYGIFEADINFDV